MRLNCPGEEKKLMLEFYFAWFFIVCTFLPRLLVSFGKDLTDNAQFILNGLKTSLFSAQHVARAMQIFGIDYQ